MNNQLLKVTKITHIATHNIIYGYQEPQITCIKYNNMYDFRQKVEESHKKDKRDNIYDYCIVIMYLK